MNTTPQWQVHNEFASVALSVVPYGRGSRLAISAGRLETTGVIDPTVLEALTVLSEAELMQIVAMATDPRSDPDDCPPTPTT